MLYLIDVKLFPQISLRCFTAGFSLFSVYDGTSKGSMTSENGIIAEENFGLTNEPKKKSERFVLGENIVTMDYRYV